MSKWFAAGYQSGSPRGNIIRSRGIIESVSVNTEGEALGHGVFLDESFIDAVIEQGNAKTQGVKARFGHPNMCSTALGTFIGRFKNFRKEVVTRDDGSKAWRAVADLFMSNAARETPNGDLYNYVFDMAESDDDMFGTSIVFEPGQSYYKTFDGRRVYSSVDSGIVTWLDADGKEVSETEIDLDKPYATLTALHGCDVVDDPAANDGLFSRFAKETVAGQITQFFDQHPQVWEAVTGNTEVLEAIAKYGDKIDEFITRYSAHKHGVKNMTEEVTTSEQEELCAVVVDNEGNEIPQTPAPEVKETAAEPEAVEDDKSEDSAEEPAETVEDLPAESGEEIAAESREVEEEAELTTVLDEGRLAIVSEFRRMKENFGVEIASEIFESGGSYEDAKDRAFEKLKEENEQLRAKVAEAPRGGTAARVSNEGREKKPLFKVK